MIRRQTTKPSTSRQTNQRATHNATSSKANQHSQKKRQHSHQPNRAPSNASRQQKRTKPNSQRTDDRRLHILHDMCSRRTTNSLRNLIFSKNSTKHWRGSPSSRVFGTIPQYNAKSPRSALTTVPNVVLHHERQPARTTERWKEHRCVHDAVAFMYRRRRPVPRECREAR